MKSILPIALCAFLLFYFTSCQKDFNQLEKYKRPDWLAGKLYTQIEAQSDLRIFAQSLELTGYDSIINTSGSYTIFAPNDEAFNLFFQNHPNYKTLKDIPLAELTRIVKYHIVQNPWSIDQLKSLDIYGWIDSLDLNNNLPKGYKRETILRENDQKYGIFYNNDKILTIVDTSQSKWFRKQATDSRKYAPIFFKEYFDIYKLDPVEYEFYFNRPFESPSDVYYVNGRIVKDDIFAENGFIHIIDQIVLPLQNAYQLLSNKNNPYSYTDFLELVNNFPEFTYNQQKTFQQPGADQGLLVDSLFDLNYPELAFSITNELTKPPSGTMGLPSNVSIRYHHGLIAPTNEALAEFVNQYLLVPNGWGKLETAPLHLKRIIANTHMSSSPIYGSDLNMGFPNGEKDVVQVENNTIIQKNYGSNCTFIGVNKVIVPRAFKSVTGPVYLQRGYSKVMFGIEEAGLLPALKRQNNTFMFYVESDNNTTVDSSFIYNTFTKQFYCYTIGGQIPQRYNLTKNELRTLILNHVAIEYPRGNARKEFIMNMAGNHLIYNNLTGEVSGTAPTAIGFRGSIEAPNFPIQISTNADNGKTFDIKNWFKFSSTGMYAKISSTYPKFHQLLIKAALVNEREYRYTFLSENENYTIFAPTDQALDDIKADTLSVEELKKNLLLHFIQGNLIFTDGNKPEGYYETTRIDEKSTTFTTIYTKLFVRPGQDVITISDKSGKNYITIDESPSVNIITSRNLGTGQEVFPVLLSNGVIHEINKVLLYKDVLTE